MNYNNDYYPDRDNTSFGRGREQGTGKRAKSKVKYDCVKLNIDQGACFSCGQQGHRANQNGCPYLGTPLHETPCGSCQIGGHSKKFCLNTQPDNQVQRVSSREGVYTRGNTRGKTGGPRDRSGSQRGRVRLYDDDEEDTLDECEEDNYNDEESEEEEEDQYCFPEFPSS